MTPFFLVLMAIALWILAGFGIWMYLRRTPESPEKSVRGFRRERLQMASVVPSKSSVGGIEMGSDPAASRLVRAVQAELGEEDPTDDLEAQSTQEIEPVTSLRGDRSSNALGATTLARPDKRSTELRESVETDVAEAATLATRYSDDISEDELEVGKLISSISFSGPPRPKRKAPKRKPVEPESGPKTTDGVTYFLIDDEGRPLE